MRIPLESSSFGGLKLEGPKGEAFDLSQPMCLDLTQTDRIGVLPSVEDFSGILGDLRKAICVDFDEILVDLTKAIREDFDGILVDLTKAIREDFDGILVDEVGPLGLSWTLLDLSMYCKLKTIIKARTRLKKNTKPRGGVPKPRG